MAELNRGMTFYRNSDKPQFPTDFSRIYFVCEVIPKGNDTKVVFYPLSNPSDKKMKSSDKFHQEFTSNGFMD